MLKHLPDVDFDVLLLDINLTDRNGIDVLKHVKQMFPKRRVIMLSMHSDASIVMRALQAGADGYVHKSNDSQDIFNALETVSSGRIYLISESNQHVIKKAIANHTAENLPHETLSDRELEVLIMLGQGVTNTEIGKKLHLSPKTISTYKQRLLAKMHFTNTVQLFEYVQKHNLI